MSNLETRARWRLATLAATGMVGAVVAVLAVGPLHHDLTEAVRRAGPAAPLAFVALYGALSLVLVPGSAMTVAAGVLFGTLLGTLLAVVGGVIGATLAFLVGRRLGRRQVEHLAGDRMNTLDRWLEQRGVLAIAIVRVVPGVPYSLLNYAAGVTGMRTCDYVTGTAFGLVPGAFVYAAFGGTLEDPASPEFVGAVALLLGFLGAGGLLNRWMGP